MGVLVRCSQMDCDMAEWGFMGDLAYCSGSYIVGKYPLITIALFSHIIQLETSKRTCNLKYTRSPVGYRSSPCINKSLIDKD